MENPTIAIGKPTTLSDASPLTPEETTALEQQYLEQSFRGRCPGCRLGVALDEDWVWVRLVQRSEERLRPAHNSLSCLGKIREVAWLKSITVPTMREKVMLRQHLGENAAVKEQMDKERQRRAELTLRLAQEREAAAKRLGRKAGGRALPG